MIKQIQSSDYGFPRLTSLLSNKVGSKDRGDTSNSGESNRGRSGSRSRCYCVLALALLVFGGWAHAQDAEAKYKINVPAQDAASALEQLAEQTGALTLFPYDLVANLTTNAVIGRFTLPVALNMLLEDTGLSGGLSEKRVISISTATAEVLKDEEEPMELKRTGFFAALATAFTSLGAVAQQSADTGRNVLEEVIVTAERRETALQDTPVSIAAFASQELVNMGVTNLEDLQNIAPSLVSSGNRASGNANMSIAIRGIGQRGARAATGRGVGLYIDDVYFPVTQGSRVNFVDISRLEVLRGPQGTLFGRNNVGGAVRYFTNPADTEATYGSVNLRGSEFDGRRLEGIFNLGISEKFAARFVAIRDQRDGSQHFVDVNGQRTDREPLGEYANDLLRASLSWMPSDTVSVGLTVEHVEAQNNGVVYDVTEMPNVNAGYAARLRDAFTNEGIRPLAANDPRLVTASEFTNLDACLIDGDGLFSTRGVGANPANPFPNCDTSRETDMQSVRLNVNWDLTDSLSMTSITGFGNVEVANRIDWTTFGAYMRLEQEEIDYWSQEFRLNGNTDDGRLNWVVGLNVASMEAQENIDLWDVLPNTLIPRVNSLQRQNFDDYAWGIFAQLTYAITDDLNLTIGARHTDEDKDIATQRTDRNDNFLIENSAGWSDNNVRLTLDYHFTDDVMIYGTYSDSFKAGSFVTNISESCNRALTGDPLVCDDASELVNFASIEPLDPEQVENIEIGIRATFMDRLRFNLTGFMMDYTDLQQRSRVEDPSDPDCSGGFEDGVCSGIFLPGSIGAEISGVEAELLFLASDRITLNANIASLDTEVTEADGVAGLDVGTPLDQAPELSYTFGIRHDFEFRSGMRLNSSLNYSYKDEYFPVFTSDRDNPIQELVTVSARVQLSPADQAWTLAFGATNLTDETYETNINHWRNFIGQLRSSDRYPPRVWYAEFQYNFGN